MADFGFANFGDDDENEEEEFDFKVNNLILFCGHMYILKTNLLACSGFRA